MTDSKALEALHRRAELEIEVARILVQLAAPHGSSHEITLAVNEIMQAITDFIEEDSKEVNL